jgi:hypothetical protein
VTQPILSALEDREHCPVTDGAAGEAPPLSATDKGDISEIAFELEARRRGWTVCTPRGNTRGFDCIVLRPQSIPVLVQIKAGTWIPEKAIYQFNNNMRGQIYLATAYDIMAVHLVREDQWLFFSRAEMGNRLYGQYAMSGSNSFVGRKYSSLCDAPIGNWERIDEVVAEKTHSRPTPPNVPPPCL